VYVDDRKTDANQRLAEYGQHCRRRLQVYSPIHSKKLVSTH